MNTEFPARVTVYEVGPRDGLQNEARIVPTEAKLEYINKLSASGLRMIEATSFVSPKAIPQLADSDQVMQQIVRTEGTTYPVLVPNIRGLDRAMSAGATHIAVFTAASESFTRANINATIQGSLDNFRELIPAARASGTSVRGYVSTAFGCPYEGAVSPDQVRRIALALLEMGIYEVSIGDTLGVANPRQVHDVLTPLVLDAGMERIAVHFHDTRGTALANTLEALRMGIATVDSSSAGLGGCPYAPGASGNLATEDLLYMLHGMGIETGVDIERVAEASQFITGVLGRPATSRYLQAWAAEQKSDNPAWAN